MISLIEPFHADGNFPGVQRVGIAERRAREFKRRTDDILHAAMDLAAADDWQSVTIDDIAERAEIGKGTLYKHFKSKDEVCACLVSNHTHRMLQALRRIPLQQEFVPRFKASIKTLWRSHMEVRAILSLSQHCTAMESSMNLSDQAAQDFQAAQREVMEYIHGLFEQGVRSGVLPNEPREFLLCCAMGTLKGAMHLIHVGMFPDLENDGFLDYLADYTLKGLVNGKSG